MQLARKNGLAVQADTYTLTFPNDRPFVYVDDASGKRWAELFVISSAHPAHAQGDTVRIHPWEIVELPGEIILTLRAESSVWKNKVYRLRCRPSRFVYEMEIEGKGMLSEVNYFGGYYSGQARWGSGFFWSGQHFKQGFSPEPNADEAIYFSPFGESAINLTGVPLPGKSDWFFTPPPFCFAFEGANGWMSMGVEAAARENRFTEYRFHAQQSSFYLSLAYEGHTRVDGKYQLPSIGFDFCPDEYAALDSHVKALRAAGHVRASAAEKKPAWWYEPIFCGWGAQCYHAAIDKRPAPEYARQGLYEGWLKTLEEHDIAPGMITIDDKWQASYGENRADQNKWPDLRGFIDRQHARGRRVLLWLKLWDPEGVPAGECITNSCGLPLAVDPSNLAYERRLRVSVRNMLAEWGYKADGFKIDFSARVPSGPGIHTYGDVWGLELMKLYLRIIYDEVKKTKPDALVIAHTPHPYLADVLDMVRLNDINTNTDVNKAMTHRARVARIACPDAIVDTDNWPITNKAAWREYVRLQPELGVPSLYYASHIDSTLEPLDAADYQLIQETWARHRAKVRRATGPLTAPKRETAPLGQLVREKPRFAPGNA